MTHPYRLLRLALAAAAALAAGCALADLHDHDEDSPAELHEIAAKRVYWRAHGRPGPASENAWLKVKVLAINDFHGQLSADRRVANRPAGGAAVLAAYLEAAQAGMEDRTLIVHAGDHVGASPPASALLQDEPSLSFLNLLANQHCRYQRRLDPRCNLVGTLGNHEFDEGVTEGLRLIYGGNSPKGPFLEAQWRGATFPYVSANVVHTATGRPILPPYVIKRVRGMPIAFIGAVLKATPTIVTPSGVAGVTFLDEAESINKYVPELRARGVRSIVVTIHQGGRQVSYAGPTSAGAVSGDILPIIDRLDDEIDVVVSGHSHAFSNAIVKNRNGKEILLTQAFSASTAYADIELEIDPASKDVMAKSAAIVTTFGDVAPGNAPDPQVAQLVKAAEDEVAPLVNQVIGTAAADITRAETAAGESALGNLIADAQRAATGAEFGFMNPGGIRADIAAGQVTWGELFTVQPFGNSLVRMTLSGQQVYDVLEQQWAGQTFLRIMKTSGFTYTWDNARPAGSRVVEVRAYGVPIDKTASYTVVCNSFMADGGDNFTVFRLGTSRVGGDVDLDALIDYVKALPQPFDAVIEGRIQRLN